MNWRNLNKFLGGHDLAGDPQVGSDGDSAPDETSARKLSGVAAAETPIVHAAAPSLEGGEATCSEPRKPKSGTSDAGGTVQAPPLACSDGKVYPPGSILPPGVFPPSRADVDDMMLQIQRDELIQAQLNEQPIFTTGEIILVKGVLWKVKAITEKRLYLDIYRDAGQRVR